MSVTPDTVRHVAALARVGLEESRITSLVAELNTILEHMKVLTQVDTSGETADTTGAVHGMPLRPDESAPIPLLRARDQFAPSHRDGFFMVPRLATHEEEE